jgi:hypothetical protein
LAHDDSGRVVLKMDADFPAGAAGAMRDAAGANVGSLMLRTRAWE